MVYENILLNAVNYTGKMFSYDSIYEYFTCVKFYKCYNQGIHSYFTETIANYIPIHNHMTRFTDNERLNLPRQRLASSQKYFQYTATKTRNTLPIQLRSLSSMDSFKFNLKLHISLLINKLDQILFAMFDFNHNCF